jgi:DNA-binding NarL/FixJ family response regulator
MLHKPQIILVDDHLIFRQGLKSVMTFENIANVIGEASNADELTELLLKLAPDLIIMDIDMPEMNGLENAWQAIQTIPDLKIIAYTLFGDEEHYQRMADLGVKGLILKSSGISEFEKAIGEVMTGNSYFSGSVPEKAEIHDINKN